MPNTANCQNHYNVCLFVRIPQAQVTTLSTGDTVWLCQALEAAPTDPALHQITVLILPCIKKEK